MIGILSQGRLGNQMFQYAFIYAASKKLNTPFFIYNSNALHYFKLHDDLQKDNRVNILKFALRHFFKSSRIRLSRKTIRYPINWLKDWSVYKNIFIWRNTTNEKNYFLSSIKNNFLYDGYFHSEEYFAHLKEEIFKQFEIKLIYQQDFSVTKSYLFHKKTISMHIRRTDFIDFGNELMGGYNVILPSSYYKNCLALIENINDYNVIFISDDIEFVKSEFGTKHNYFFESNSEIIDFQIILNTNIVVIANSTFSWWAAWLNEKVDKIVYAPNYYLGFKVKKFYPVGIKVKEWKWIDVN